MNAMPESFEQILHQMQRRRHHRDKPGGGGRCFVVAA